MLFLVDEWRAKWHLNMRFDDATPEELIKDMEDIHPHVRIKAISTCARASSYKPPPLEGNFSKNWQVYVILLCLVLIGWLIDWEPKLCCVELWHLVINMMPQLYTTKLKPLD